VHLPGRGKERLHVLLGEEVRRTMWTV